MFNQNDVVFSYTRADALEDGQQINISNISNEAGFKFPVFITNSVNSIIEESLQFGNDWHGVMWDILTILRIEIKNQRSQNNQIHFTVLIKNSQKALNKENFVCEVGPYDFDNPTLTLTIMTLNDI